MSQPWNARNYHRVVSCVLSIPSPSDLIPAMEGIPSSSSSSATIHWPFDVFINYREIDGKNMFASHIYYPLESFGICVFLHQNRMETGELIEEAIGNSSVHIAIFSKNYVGPPWCLNEVCLIMENPHEILAVFHDVESCDLRWMDKDGPYAKALKTHHEKGRFKEEWKRALFNASGRSGCELEKGFNGDEENQIVNNVLKRVKRDPLDVAKYPVGLDEVAEDFRMLLLADGIDDKNVKVVEIVGMGGAGKTTLVKHFLASANRIAVPAQLRELNILGCPSEDFQINKTAEILPDAGVV